MITYNVYYIGHIVWHSDRVDLISPTVKQCENVMYQLKVQRNNYWEITLWSSSPDSLLIVLNNINECLVTRLDIWNTPFDSDCVHGLSHALYYNRTMEGLHLLSSPLLPNSIQTIGKALFKLKRLWLICDHTIVDEDIAHICDHMIDDITLNDLRLYCPNVTDFGRQQLSDMLTKNKTLTMMVINGIVKEY